MFENLYFVLYRSFALCESQNKREQKAVIYMLGFQSIAAVHLCCLSEAELTRPILC